MAEVEMQPMSVQASDAVAAAAGGVSAAASGVAETVAGLIYPLEVDGGDDEDDVHAELSGPLLSPRGKDDHHHDQDGGDDDRDSSPRRQKRTRSDIDPELTPMTVPHRWVQLGYLSLLALLSDWICFSTASNPEAFESAYRPIPAVRPRDSSISFCS